MKIVIDISEVEYNKIEPFLNGETTKGGFNLFRALEIIKNGTPLPKGHGRLIDGDYLYKKFVANKCPDSLVLQFVNDEPTIIEADVGETE